MRILSSLLRWWIEILFLIALKQLQSYKLNAIMLYRAKRIQITRPIQQTFLTYPTLQQLALFPAFEHDGWSWELLLLSKILLFLTQSVVLMASLIVYHKCSMEYSFNCHILFLNKVKLYMFAVYNILWGTYVPWVVACHVKCASLVMRSLSMLQAAPPTLQAAASPGATGALWYHFSFFPFYLRLCDLCDLCLTSSLDPGNQRCTFCLWAVSSSL